MQSKGVNQIDFAVAVSILITIFIFTVTFITNYYSGPRQVVDTTKLFVDALSLEQTAFGSRGVPPHWNWKGATTRPSLASDIWYTQVHIVEKEGVHVEGNLELEIKPGESYGESNAWSESVMVYDDHELLPTNVPGANGFMDTFNVVFPVELDPFEKKTFYIYYSQDNKTSSDFDTGLSSDNMEGDLEIKILSERSILGLTPYKLYLADNMVLDEIREKYDLERNFNITVYTEEDQVLVDDYVMNNFTIGSSIPELADTETYSNKITYQNSTGHLKNILYEATVW